MIYGYCRVSTKGQERDGNSLDCQEKEILEKYPGAEIYKEAHTGSKCNRPVFTELIAKLKPGDTLAVCKMDRFARNTQEGLATIQELFKRGVAVHIFNVGLLEDNPMGKFFITIMLSVAELERNQIIERTQTGKKAAKEAAEARGEEFIDGRPIKYSYDDIVEALSYLSSHSFKQTVKACGISKSTLIRCKRLYEKGELENYYRRRKAL